MIIVYFLFLFLLLIISLILFLFLVTRMIESVTMDAPFVPIPDTVVDEIVELFGLGDTSVLYDLGCGDARILQKAVEKNPSITAIGIEKAYFPFFIAKWKTRREKNIHIRREDIFNTDPRDATHIFVYLFPEVLTKLFPTLQKKCRPGTKIFSPDFECADRKPTEVIDLENGNTRGKKLFVYML